MKKALCKMLALMMVIFVSCQKDDKNDDSKTSDSFKLAKIEKEVRKAQDSRAVFTYNEYIELLTELQNSRYSVLPMKEFANANDSTKVIVAMRHDVDAHPFKAKEMADLEKQRGIRATYYILPTALYYGSMNKKEYKRNDCMATIYKQIANLGHEIGIHNDLLTVLIEYKLDPMIFNKQELDFFKTNGISIVGTASHGSAIASKTVPNYEMFSDFNNNQIIEYLGERYVIGQYSLHDYGYEYESYFVKYDKYICDVSGHWNLDGGLNIQTVITALKNCKPGTKVQILTHPLWWGK